MTDITDPARVFRKLARNNHLANRRLQAACRALAPGEWEAPRTSFFPSLKATLNHILVVDWFYVDALEGGTLGPKAWENEEPCADIDSLAAAQEAVDARLIALCDGLSPEDLAREVKLHRSGRVQTDRRDDILSHLFQHQTHHRGQAHAMLAGTSVKPPQLDEFITGDDRSYRAADLEALGWSEVDLMR